MNEEEKKAIEELKSFKKDKDCKYWIGINGEKAIDIIINLIENQQKEIESRLKEIDSLYKMMSDKDDKIEKLKENGNKKDNFTTVYLQGFYDGKKNFKYKIKELIEELESVLDLAEDDKRFAKYKKEALKEEINDLKELLGE